MDNMQISKNNGILLSSLKFKQTKIYILMSTILIYYVKRGEVLVLSLTFNSVYSSTNIPTVEKKI